MGAKNKLGFTKFETIMGLAVVAIIALAAPWLGGELRTAKSTEARAESARIAQSVLDFHTETGRWPGDAGRPIDLAALTEQRTGQVAMGSLVSGGTGAWLDEVPADGWGRPYVAVVFDEREPAVARSEGPPAKPHHYPSKPPQGVTIVVISTGPDGELDTEPAILAHRSVPIFGDDDTGFVLR